MSALRRSSRVRKPITSIDQNLNDDDDDLIIVPKTRKSKSVAEKRPSCDDDEQEMITPKKRQRKKPSTTATKTSPYFDTSDVSRVNTQKKSVPPKAKSKNRKMKTNSNDESSMNVDENDAGSVATKITTESDAESDSDSDDANGWEVVQSKPSEEVIIHKLLKEREERVAGEVEVTLNEDEVAAANRKKKKDIHSREHQLELHLKRVIKKTCLQKHQHHIVCNLAHGFHIVKTYIKHLELRALMLSIIDDEMKQALFYNNKTTNMNDIHRLLNYFNELFIINNNNPSVDEEKQQQQPVTLEKLRRALNEHVVSSTSPIRIILFAIFVRLLHYECRLIFAADLPPIRPRALQEEKLIVPHGSLIRNIKKKKKSTMSNEDDTSNSMEEDTSRLHAHDHSSDLSRVVTSSSTVLVKDNQAISPPPSHQLKPRYYWIELYLDDGYIPIDIYNSKINCPMEIENSVPFPMLYVWTFDVDSPTQCVKDVTKRYSQKWLTTHYRTAHIEHKTNGAPKWYAKLMGKYQTKDKIKTKHSKAEDQQIENQLARQPVPQSKSELLGHPLYVLKSKILKFEGVYPNDTQPVGWLKEEPIYPRDNLRTLRSKQTWLKEARQVNDGEEPYKIVDGRIKNSARKMGITTRPQLELFGEWQTSIYEPPEAKDGIVPCNEYGNVDLFRPEMIPRGCVHINEPNVSRICKKLGINFAQAITGFDAHGGMSHPVMEGIVVCQEHEHVIREALEKQEQMTIEKEIKKRDERIYKNWRKLIRGLIIKQNLSRKYADDEDGKELATDAKYQWPLLPKDDDDENAM